MFCNKTVPVSVTVKLSDVVLCANAGTVLLQNIYAEIQSTFGKLTQNLPLVIRQDLESDIYQINCDLIFRNIFI